MWGSIWRAAIVVAVVAGGAAPAAADEGSYVPKTPREPGLDGSTVQSLCVDEAPTIGYSIVRVGDTDAAEAGRVDDGSAFVFRGAATRGARAELVLSGEGRRLTVPLATAADGTGQGTVLWPGVVTDDGGTVIALPGWERAGEDWRPRDDDAAWTTGDITARLEVGELSIDVPLAYPGYSEECATPGGVASNGVTGGLAMTGGQLPVAAALGGTAAVLVGALLVARRRRRVES